MTKTHKYFKCIRQDILLIFDTCQKLCNLQPDSHKQLHGTVLPNKHSTDFHHMTGQILGALRELKKGWYCKLLDITTQELTYFLSNFGKIILKYI